MGRSLFRQHRFFSRGRSRTRRLGLARTGRHRSLVRRAPAQEVKTRHFILLGCLAAAHGFGQGTFQNLNFEGAVVVSTGSGTIQFGPAFPGWTGYFGSSALTPTSSIRYNDPSIGAAALELMDSLYPGFGQFGIISNHTALLQSDIRAGSVDVSLAQTGVIPVGTMSLRFQALEKNPNGVVVSLNGQPLLFGAVQDYGNWINGYAADISAWAGQTAELRFTQRGAGLLSGDLYFDNIIFSPEAVPEPGTWALLALGSAALGCAARRRRK